MLSCIVENSVCVCRHSPVSLTSIGDSENELITVGILIHSLHLDQCSCACRPRSPVSSASIGDSENEPGESFDPSKFYSAQDQDEDRQSRGEQGQDEEGWLLHGQSGHREIGEEAQKRVLHVQEGQGNDLGGLPSEWNAGEGNGGGEAHDREGVNGESVAAEAGVAGQQGVSEAAEGAGKKTRAAKKAASEAAGAAGAKSGRGASGNGSGSSAQMNGRGSGGAAKASSKEYGKINFVNRTLPHSAAAQQPQQQAEPLQQQELQQQQPHPPSLPSSNPTQSPAKATRSTQSPAKATRTRPDSAAQPSTSLQQQPLPPSPLPHSAHPASFPSSLGTLSLRTHVPSTYDQPSGPVVGPSEPQPAELVPHGTLPQAQQQREGEQQQQGHNAEQQQQGEQQHQQQEEEEQFYDAEQQHQQPHDSQLDLSHTELDLSRSRNISTYKHLLCCVHTALHR